MIFGYIRVRPTGSKVHPVSLGSLTRALGVDEFIHRIRFWGHWVHSVSLGSLVHALRVIQFIQGCWVY